MLWASLRANRERIGTVEIQRREVLDLADPAVGEAVSAYTVRLDGRAVGTVTHRYGDGAWALLAKAASLVAGAEEQAVAARSAEVGSRLAVARTRRAGGRS